MGPGLELSPHRNGAATIAIGLGEPFTLTLHTRAAPTPELRSIALIPPGTLHHLQAHGPMVFVYLDPLSDDLRRLREVDLDRLHDSFSRRADPEKVLGWGVDELCAALTVPALPAPDPRLAAVIRRLEVEPARYASVDDAAAETGLSSSRFQVLFGAAVGVPFRRYRLWRRMAFVLREASRGRSLTAAAHEAGFSSSAHLSSAFRAMCGISPSTLRKLGVQTDVA